ncbi:MAG: LPS assembly protein LptD [Gammaproteobacteria bacterium]
MNNDKTWRPPIRRQGAFTYLAGLLLGAALCKPAGAGILTERSDDYQWRLCPAERLIPLRPGYTDSTIDPESIEIRADSSRLVEGGLSQFTGDVELIRGEQSIRAEVMTYDDAANMFRAEGRTHIWNSGMTWSGESVVYDLDAETIDLDAGRYWLLNGRGRGYALNLHHDAVADITELKGVDYSTCPLSDESWRVSASTIKLNHEKDRGAAVNAVLRVRDIPVFYFPYISFPLSDKRKSGFLAPSLGSSNRSGLDTRVPYYWNIAPNHDATLTPRVLADRGMMLETEYRYLQSDYQGRANVEYLPGDDLAGGQDRSLLGLTHEHYLFGRRGYAFLTLNNVSDDEYFEDFGGNIAATSQRFLNREFNFRYRERNTFVRVIAQSYQTIDPTIPDRAKPYRLLPRLQYRGAFPITGSRFLPIMQAETTYFDHDSEVAGGRLNLSPTLQYRYIKPFFAVTNRITLHHSEYLLDDPAAQFDDRESRTVPVASVDASLFAERDLSLFEHSYLQTFEPRLFYLFAPHVPQETIPRFDGNLLETSFRNIFRENRFSGGDRIGDANQVTAAVTSRILDTQNGRELGRLSVGQIFFFRDREVTLPNVSEVDDSVSELIAEAAMNLGADWSLRGTVQWDPNRPRTEKAAAQLRFRPGLDTVFNIGYRLRRARTDVEQTDLSFRLPILGNLAIIGRWNFSLIDKRSLETIGGIEFESCCWGLRVAGRRFLRNAEGQFDTGVFVEVEFRGLGGVGQKSGSFLRRAIAGYHDPFE